MMPRKPNFYAIQTLVRCINPGYWFTIRVGAWYSRVQMNQEQTVIVEWFDGLKGIGEGKTTTGETIFLNRRYIFRTDRFPTLKPGEKIQCEIQKNDNSLYASKIVRSLGPRTEKQKTTFIEPKPLDLNL